MAMLDCIRKTTRVEVIFPAKPKSALKKILSIECIILMNSRKGNGKVSHCLVAVLIDGIRNAVHNFLLSRNLTIPNDVVTVR